MATDWLKHLRHRHTEASKNRNSGARRALAHDAGAGLEVTSVESLTLSKNRRVFTFAELSHATDNFSDDMVIGEGGFGKVYKGTLRDGRTVAIKKLDRSGLAGDTQFDIEVNTLNMMQHPNIVSLLGICAEGTERIAVLQLATKGSVRKLLKDGQSPLSWHQRVLIATGAARGLQHLHDSFDPPIVHRDVKTANVLVAGDGTVLVADFGLVRRMKAGADDADHTVAPESTQLVGTFGYMAPEYYQTGRMNEKSDVWAFGVMLLELLTAAPVVDTRRGDDCQNLVQWSQRALNSSEAMREILDPPIRDAPAKELGVVSQLAMACCNLKYRERPTMKQVVDALEAVCSQHQAGTGSLQWTESAVRPAAPPVVSPAAEGDCGSGYPSMQSSTSSVAMGHVQTEAVQTDAVQHPAVGQQVLATPSELRLQAHAEMRAQVDQILESPDLATIPSLKRLAALLASSVEMCSSFANQPRSCTRLAKLAASQDDTLKVAASRVIWYLARDPAMARRLLACEAADALMSGLESGVSDPLPSIGGLMHLNCQEQAVKPFKPSDVMILVEKLLVSPRDTFSMEDSAAAAFYLLRSHLWLQPASSSETDIRILDIIAACPGSVAALVHLLSVPSCSGSEAALRLVGALAQHVPGTAGEAVAAGAIPAIVGYLQSTATSVRSMAARAMASLLAAHPEGRSDVDLDSIVCSLCRMLEGWDPPGMKYAARLLGYLAMDPGDGRVIADRGAIPLLLSMLERTSGAQRNLMAWTTSILTRDPANIRHFVQADAARRLQHLHVTGSTLEHVTAMLACIEFGNSAILGHLGGASGLQVAIDVMTGRTGNVDTFTRAAALGIVRALCMPTDGGKNPNLELVLGANAVEEVFALLMLSSRAGRHNAARVLAELSVADVNSTHLTMQREKALLALVGALSGLTVWEKEAAAMALERLCSGALPGAQCTEAEHRKRGVVEKIIHCQGLEGLNQLLRPEHLISVKVAGAQLVRVLARSWDSSEKRDFRNVLRKDTALQLVHLLADASATVRIAAAEALAAIGRSNSENWVVVRTGLPLLQKMEQTTAEREAALLAAVILPRNMAHSLQFSVVPPEDS